MHFSVPAAIALFAVPDSQHVYAVSAPTTSSAGCFSNNYKDCLPEAYPHDPSSCGIVWLPNGAQENCIGLWKDCAGQGGGGCCGDAVCFGDADHAACVPPGDSTETPTQMLTTLEPTEAPTLKPTTPEPTTESPTQEPTTLEPTAGACTVCDDRETNWQVQQGIDCATDATRMNNKCNKDSKWTEKKYCRLSCYRAGNGYPGDVCCDDGSFDRKNLRRR